ncbi:MAG: hypothetical protein AB7I68_14885 [Porticoccaceae bacterium]
MTTPVDTPATAGATDQAGILRKVWRWCRRHPWLCLPAALIGLLIAAQVAYDTWRLHGPRPDIVASGQIVDYDTRQPVPGVWVLIYIHAYAQPYDSQGHRNWYIPEGGQTGMTSPLSTVVQTDQEGKFSYRVSAYDAFQSFGYTKFLVEYGAYKNGYESVDPDTGKSATGGEHFLTFVKPKPGQPWPFVRRVADSPDGRRASRDDFPAGISFYPQPEATWPQWSRFFQVVVGDEIDSWCQTPGPEPEDRRLLRFVQVATVLRQQRSMTESWLRARFGSDAPVPDSTASARRELDSYVQAATDFPWPDRNYPADSLNGAAASLTFNAEQKQALCRVLREQANQVFHLSMTSGKLSP